MRLFAATIIPLSLLAWACASASAAGAASEAGTPTTTSAAELQTIQITRSGAQPSRKAPAEYFTGSVRIDPLFSANDPARSSGASVTLEPGARTAWHTHPLGQILIVTAGVGRVQRWAGPIEEIRQGDVVRIPAGLKHWHGASPNTAMTHIGVSEHLDGKTVDWLEKVSDAQYGEAVQAPAPVAAAPAPPAPGAPGQPTRAQQLMGDIAPKLAELTDTVLFGDVWARPELAPRDRSLVTVSALIAMNRPDQLRSHLARARDNGVTQAEVVETITHLAFYAGWPNAITAIAVAREVFQKK
jgi:4-carboxymuconolactone decarboxylase